MKKLALFGGLFALFCATAAYAAGQFPGYPVATSTAQTGNATTLPLTGLETIPADTNLLTNTASFTGVISGTTLTASSITGSIAVGQTISGAGVQPGTQIVSGSGTLWVVSVSQTVASTAMYAGSGGVNPQTEVIQVGQLRAYALSGGTSSSYLLLGNLTVATLPTCNAALNGARSTITNGVAYSLTLAAAGAPGTAVGAATGTVTRTVLCGSTDQSSFAWVYN